MAKQKLMIPQLREWKAQGKNPHDYGACDYPPRFWFTDRAVRPVGVEIREEIRQYQRRYSFGADIAAREGETGFSWKQYLFTLPDDVLKRLY